MSDGLAQEFAEKVKTAAANKQTLAIVGGGTSRFSIAASGVRCIGLKRPVVEESGVDASSICRQ